MADPGRLVDVDEQHRLQPLEIALATEEPVNTIRTVFRPRLQTTAWLTAPKPVKPEQRLGAQQADAERAVVDEAGVDQADAARVGRTSV